MNNIVRPTRWEFPTENGDFTVCIDQEDFGEYISIQDGEGNTIDILESEWHILKGVVDLALSVMNNNNNNTGNIHEN